MNDLENIPNYVFDSLRGKGTDKQQVLLKQWLEKGPNEEVYKQLQKIDVLSHDLKWYHHFDVQQARDAVEKTIKKRGRMLWLSRVQKYAAILLLPLLIVTFYFFNETQALKREMADNSVIQQIYTQPGTRSHFFLSDSTEVWLNSASIIQFPSSFSGEERLVELNGQAFFKVSKNKKKPFIVKNGGYRVKAVGTAFDMNAYTGDKKFVTTLQEGEIFVSDSSSKETISVFPGEQARFSFLDQKISKERVNVENVIGWRDGKIIFDQMPLDEITTVLGRWFNAEIHLVDKSIANYRYTATFTDESLRQVLELLKLTAPIEYTMEKRIINKDNLFNKEMVTIRMRPDLPL